MVKRRDIEAREVKDLELARIGEELFQVRGVFRAGRDLHHIGRTIAGGKLHHAQAIAMRIETHGLGVDGHDRAERNQFGASLGSCERR